MKRVLITTGLVLLFGVMYALRPHSTPPARSAPADPSTPSDARKTETSTGQTDFAAQISSPRSTQPLPAEAVTPHPREPDVMGLKAADGSSEFSFIQRLRLEPCPPSTCVVFPSGIRAVASPAVTSRLAQLPQGPAPGMAR